MSDAISLDNQTILSQLVDSFINFFQLQNFHLFPYFSFISQRIWYKGGGGGVQGLGPGGDSLLGGATCRGQLTLFQYVHLKKKINPADAFFQLKIYSFRGDNQYLLIIIICEHVHVNLPTISVTHVMHNNSQMDYYAIHQIEWISIYQEK